MSTPARFKQITFAAKSIKAWKAGIKKPHQTRSHVMTRGGSKATATITPTKVDDSPFIRERIAATQETKATMIK